VRYFGEHGIPARRVLGDARAIAASSLVHDFVVDGPHIVTGPIAVRDAEPGDVLRIDVVGLVPRAPYGVISNRHGKGALPNEFPETPKPEPGASAQRPELFHNVSVFTPVRHIDGRDRGVLPVRGSLRAEFPIDPFMGMIGVALDTAERVDSVPPTKAGGNIDIRDLTVGSTLYLPVFVPGAKFYVGDPHFAQGDGEICGTAIEASLDATIQVFVVKGLGATSPLLQTDTHWLTHGFGADLDAAMRAAAEQMLWLMQQHLGLSADDAYSLASVAVDLGVTQVVDGTLGCHAAIARSMF
jgi:acetamidase/formamidase